MEQPSPPSPQAPAGRPRPSLQVCLLGRFEVVRGETLIPPEAWRRRRPADLLKLVALSPGHAVTRDQAIDALWPDKDPASGANNLHRALYDLRQILGGRWVDIERGVIRMRPDAQVDVDAFEAALAAGKPESAVSIYRGDLSPEDRVSEWLVPRRTALRRAFAEAALPLARRAAEQGDAGTAVSLLRRVVEVRPASEEAHRLLMRVLAEQGRRADALRQYDVCEQAVRVGREGTPDPETRALRDAIQRGELGPRPTPSAFDGYRRAALRLLGSAEPPPLRGRTAALLLLESIVEQGSGALVLLGERGVGKTRLALEGARIAQERGAVVMAGTPPGAAPAPYSLVASAWADYQAAAGAPGGDPFAPASPAGWPEEQPRRVLEGVQRSLAAAGGGRPVYLIVEDVHHADESSLHLLHFLARSARSIRLMLVVTCREDEVHAGSPVQMFLSHLDCERLARGIRVQRLGIAATREQLADVLGSPPTEALVTQIYRVTDGSPFYTEEVARAFKESGHLALPDSPAAAVRSRVARLGPRVEALLAAAAVAGPRFDLDVIRPVSRLAGSDVMQALEACLEARLVDEEGGGYHFHHSLVREAIYESLPPGRRLELHRATADAIEAGAAAGRGAGEVSEALGFHRRAAEQFDQAFRQLAAAGHRAAARGGTGEALSFYLRALELADAAHASGEERLEIHESAGRVQLVLADLGGAGRTFRAIAEMSGPGGWRPDPSHRARARHLEAMGLIAAGRPAEAEPLLEAALAETAGGPDDEAAAVLQVRTFLAWHAGDGRHAVALAERWAAESTRIGDADGAGRARQVAAMCRGEAPREPSAACAGAGAEGLDEPFEVHLPLWERALHGDRPFSEVEAAASRLSEWARSCGVARTAAVARAAEGALALEGGRWDVAEAALRDAAEQARACGFALGEAFALERLGVLLTARGRIDEAQSLLGAGLVAAERAVLRRHALVRLHASLARNRLAAGAHYAAEEWLREASETSARHGDCAICDGLLRPEAVRVALARGRVAEAESEAAAFLDVAGRRQGRTLASLARLARGRVLGAQRRAGEALATLAEARQGFLAVGAAYEAARCLAAQARALGAAGEGQAAEARRIEDQAEQELVAIGASASDA